MPLKCTIRPNRTKRRVFTAKDAGRIACEALKDGALLADLRKEVQRCVPCEDDEKNRNRLMEMLAANTAALQVALTIVAAMLIAMNGLLIAGRFIPQLRLVSIAARALFSRVAAAETQISQQIAANERLFTILQQEAANAAQFAVRAGAR